MSWSKQNHLLDQNLAPQNQNSQRLEKGVYHSKLKLVEVQNSLHALSVSVWFFVPAFYRDALPKISQYALNNFDCSEKTILRASLHSVSGTWDSKNTKANFVLVCFLIFSSYHIMMKALLQHQYITKQILSGNLHYFHRIMPPRVLSLWKSLLKCTEVYFTNEAVWAPQLAAVTYRTEVTSQMWSFRVSILL